MEKKETKKRKKVKKSLRVVKVSKNCKSLTVGSIYDLLGTKIITGTLRYLIINDYGEKQSVSPEDGRFELLYYEVDDKMNKAKL